jgi:integrase
VPTPATLGHVRNILNQCFKYALREELIDKNPCDFLVLPKKKKREVDYYNEEEIKEMLDSFRGDKLYPLIYLDVLYGLRRSEILGLQWDSVDFDRNLLYIKHTVVPTPDGETVRKDKTKNASSNRCFPLF